MDSSAIVWIISQCGFMPLWTIRIKFCKSRYTDQKWKYYTWIVCHLSTKGNKPGIQIKCIWIFKHWVVLNSHILQQFSQGRQEHLLNVTDSDIQVFRRTQWTEISLSLGLQKSKRNNFNQVWLYEMVVWTCNN